MADVVFRKGYYTPTSTDDGTIYVNFWNKTETIGTSSGRIVLTDAHLLRELCLGKWTFDADKLFNYLDPLYQGVHSHGYTIQNVRFKYIEYANSETVDTTSTIEVTSDAQIYFGSDCVVTQSGSSVASTEIHMDGYGFEILNVSSVTDDDICKLVEFLDACADKEIVNYNKCLTWQTW